MRSPTLHHAIRDVRCVHCRRMLRIAAAARSTTCPHCYRGMDFDDVVIRAEWTGKISTVGRIEFAPACRAKARCVRAAGPIDIAGIVEGDVASAGSIHVHSGGELRGSIRASGVEVEPGGKLSGTLTVEPPAA